MDWQALLLSLKLSLTTVIILLPVGIIVGRWLAYNDFRGKSVLLAGIALPLVLPPTVLGFYLLVLLGEHSAVGQTLMTLFGQNWVFTFQGLVLASIIFNLPFAIQPMERAFKAIPHELREAGACCGMRPDKILWRIELPLAWPGIISAMIMTFAHTLGEFGVVLMIGGNIPGETQTIAIAIYDRVQAFDNEAAGTMSAFLLGFSMVTISLTYWLTGRSEKTHG